ncbi:MAG: hypothetical protein WA662_20210, partial [Pseudolabrys sp.]
LLTQSGHTASRSIISTARELDKPRPPRCRHDMLIQPQEANLVTYNVGLCLMVNGNLDAPYEGASIEAANIPDALLKAKKWAASVEVADNSWLQILLDGRSVRSLKPGSF